MMDGDRLGSGGPAPGRAVEAPGRPSRAARRATDNLTRFGSRPMMLLKRFTSPLDGIPAWRFALRVVWVAAQLIAVICLGNKGVLFFYQAF
jgi:hypothetical protein